jgi:thiol-disulfide isomerase/thioredoxin
MYKLLSCLIFFVIVDNNLLAMPIDYYEDLLYVNNVQPNADTPLYIKNKAMPYFAMRLIDSSMTYRSRFPKKMPVLLVYFNPDCDHCKDEAKQLMEHKDDFKKLYIVFISTAALPSIKEFAETYNIQGKNIIIGRDEAYKLPPFYSIRFSPFVVLYNKDKNIENVYEGGISWQKLKQVLANLL